MDVLCARVTLLVGDYDDVKKYLPQEAFECCDYMARCVYRKEHGKYPFRVFIHSHTAAVSLIAHEAVHAASYIMEGMGLVSSFENDELNAYIVQHICSRYEDKADIYG